MRKPEGYFMIVSLILVENVSFQRVPIIENLKNAMWKHALDIMLPTKMSYIINDI